MKRINLILLAMLCAKSAYASKAIITNKTNQFIYAVGVKGDIIPQGVIAAVLPPNAPGQTSMPVEISMPDNTKTPMPNFIVLYTLKAIEKYRNDMAVRAAGAAGVRPLLPPLIPQETANFLTDLTRNANALYFQSNGLNNWGPAEGVYKTTFSNMSVTAKPTGELVITKQ